MNPGLKIELTEKAEKIAAGMQTMPARIVRAIVSGMDQANQVAVGNIKSTHLTGTGPYPVSEHKLGRVTGRLRGSAYATGTQQTSDSQVQSAIGSNVIYAAIHEFGGRIHHKARQVTVRHKTDARGNLVTRALTRKVGDREISSPNSMLIFAKAGAKRVRETKAHVAEHDTIMPERAPFRTGLEESKPVYKNRISAAIAGEWEKLSS